MDAEDKKILTELNNGFRIFIKEWDDVKHNGFRFCATNKNELKNVKEDVAELKRGKAAKWVERAFIVIMTLILTTSVGLMLGGIKNGKASAEARGYISDSKPDGVGEGNK